MNLVSAVMSDLKSTDASEHFPRAAPLLAKFAEAVIKHEKKAKAFATERE